ncbi:MAG: ABC transporter ATP-binding protein [Bacteroidia bacterium]|nr:ABC transporter ATP-binding protein [Bacteroidia bacterium]
MVEVNDLHKEYTKGKTKISAVNGISLTVNKGEFVSIVGKSGSGKSTLLNLLAGLDTATSGEIKFNGTDICKFSRKEMAYHRRKTIGIVFQSFNLIATRTALENIMLALAFGGIKRSERKAKAIQLLEKVGLGNRYDHKPSELSGGEAQRVAIARALANDPHFILADEPTGNLDTNTTNDILTLLQNLRKEEGRTIIMITHDLETAQTVSDKIFTVSDGKLINKN